MPRKRKEKVVFAIPEDVQSAPQNGWVQRESPAPPFPGEAQAAAESAPISPTSHAPGELPAVSLLPARQYEWSVPPPSRLASLKTGIERGIAICAIPFEIGITLALGLCSDPRERVRRATGIRTGRKDEQ